METNVWKKLYPSVLPSTLKRLLVWGVPSLALLGLMGFAGWKWLRKTKHRKFANSSPAPEKRKTDVSAAAQNSPGSEDSGVVDLNSQGGESRKTSEEDLRAVNVTPFVPHHHHQRLTSSNVHVRRSVANDSETPLKPSSSNTWKYPTASSDLQSETFSELDSISSSEGLLSLPPNKSPANFESSGAPSPTLDIDQSFRFVKSKNIASSTSAPNIDESAIQGEGEITPQQIPGSKSTPLFNKQDRVRVMLSLPRDLVGRFIGKQGRNIKALMADSSGAHVYVNQKNLPKEALIVPCTVQGTSEQVEQALRIIEMKYPEVEVPSLLDNDPMSRVPLPSPLFGTPQLNGESWDVILKPAYIPTTSFSAMVSYIENLRCVWLVSCEKSIELDELHQSMSYTYCYAVASGNDTAQPKEGDDSLLGKFCSVRVSEIHWLRGRVSRFGDDGHNYEVQLMDYGSIVIVPGSAIRPLRREHSRLPIQAFKCMLASVEPVNALSESGLVGLQQMVEGMVLEVHITGSSPTTPPTTDDSANMSATPTKQGEGDLDGTVATTIVGELVSSPTDPVLSTLAEPVLSPLAPYTPLIELYTQLGAQSPIFINRELVESGFATWKETDHTPSTTH